MLSGSAPLQVTTSPARLVSEHRGDLVVVRLIGTIDFDEPDYRMSEDLAKLLRRHVGGGARMILADFSEAVFLWPSSFALGVLPFLQQHVVGPSRVAACVKQTGRNVGLLGRCMDCFETESEAVAFLQSEAPMINPNADDNLFWNSIGEEIGPEGCRRGGCSHLRVALSHYCRRHHYEMVRGIAYSGSTDTRRRLARADLPTALPTSQRSTTRNQERD
jgi:hypothetical protein